MNANRRPDWLDTPPAAIDQAARAAAQARQAQLTKPPGSLGRLETIAVQLAGLQGDERPAVDPVRIVVFAGDHGIAAAGVSAYPQAVTAEMVRNFARGGAAISVLARQLEAGLEVINLGTVADPGALEGVYGLRLGPGTADFRAAPAMDEHQCARALAAGRQAVERAHGGGCRLFVGGEMGIGNTTSASALACALLGTEPVTQAGPGTGLDDAGVAHKAAVIGQALARHLDHLGDPWQVLRRLGGFEIAALTGAYIAAAQLGMAVLVDGYICGVAALVAARLSPGSTRQALFAHASAEPGHARVLAALAAEPLFDLGLRLGEGSGAALAVPLLRQACALHNGMASFAEAGISGPA